jgi:PPM family protein phosphatase
MGDIEITGPLNICAPPVGDAVDRDAARMSADAAITVCATTDVGRERSNNEDAYVVCDARTQIMFGFPMGVAHAVPYGSTLLAVADGMGGENAGEVASGLTLQSVRLAIARRLPRGGPAAALRSAIQIAHEAVTAAADVPGRLGMGSTLVAALVEGDRAYVATIGDSRAYVLRGDRLLRLTKDQTYLQLLIDHRVLTPQEIERFPHKNVILQAIGRTKALRIPIKQWTLRRDDVILLCSDGLTGELDDDEIRAMLRAAPSLDDATRSLVAAANARGGHDNITVVVAQVDSRMLAEVAPDDPLERSLETIPPPTS